MHKDYQRLRDDWNEIKADPFLGPIVVPIVTEIGKLLAKLGTILLVVGLVWGALLTLIAQKLF